MSDAAEILDVVVREVEAGRRAALCVVVATRGSTPQAPGALLAVDEDGQAAGTIGGGCVEADFRARAHHLISVGRSELRTANLENDDVTDGMICGGVMDAAIRVFTSCEEVEPFRSAATRLRAGEDALFPLRVHASGEQVEYRVSIEAPPKLIIAGGGHLGHALTKLTTALGFRVKVIDDRLEYANAVRFPAPIEFAVGDIAATLGGERLGRDSYVVIVTRGHRSDEAALAAVIDSPVRYLGMVGSKRKIKTIYDNLRGRGVSEEQLERVHAPIGLAIRAVTPEEIAVSIAAELVAMRRGEYRKPVEGPFSVNERGE